MWGLNSGKKSRKKRKKKKPGLFARIFALLGFLWRIIKIPAVFSGIGIIIFFIWFKQTEDYQKLHKIVSSVFDTSQTTSGMVLENILLDGHKYTPKEEILAAVTGNESDGKIYIGYPMLKIDLWHIKNNLEQLTWIKHAAVTRQLPSTLSISVLEREPMALWQNDGKISLIDSDGEVIHEQNLDKFSNMIILVGKNVPFHASHFLKFISGDPLVASMISSGTLVNGRRWNITLRNGILIKLPEDNPEYSWEYLIKKQQESKILESDVKTIDLRIEKKMFVR